MAIALDVANLGGVASDASASSITFNTTSAVAAGGFLVMVGGWFASEATTVTSVTAGATGGAVDVKLNHPGATSESLFIASVQLPSGLASSSAVTANLSASPGARTMSALSFTGVATSSALDGTPPAATGSASSATWTTTASTVQAGSVLVGASWTEGSPASGTVDSPATEANERLDVSPDFYGHIVGYYVVPSTSSYSMSGTWASACPEMAGHVAYLTGAAGAPAALPPVEDWPAARFGPFG